MPSLGESQLGTEYLAGSVTYVSLEPTSATTSPQTLDSTTSADVSTEPARVVTGTKEITSVSLSPENLDIQFNESAGEFQSTWFTKGSNG